MGLSRCHSGDNDNNHGKYCLEPRADDAVAVAVAVKVDVDVAAAAAVAVAVAVAVVVASVPREVLLAFSAAGLELLLEVLAWLPLCVELVLELPPRAAL